MSTRVTRFTRVWIETWCLNGRRWPTFASPASRGCGLKLGALHRALERLPMSPASRGCGLKRVERHAIAARRWVTRFTRVWIETCRATRIAAGDRVTRFTRVWIETNATCCTAAIASVTRFTRVWIETAWQLPSGLSRNVTRFTRVWIETLRGTVIDHQKHVTRFTRVWIETTTRQHVRQQRPGSPASRGCGLKRRALAVGPGTARHPLHAGVD